MCGIAGFWLRHPADRDTLAAKVTKMAETLAHRGPDGSACWCDAESGIALGHRRLAVVDLSVAGRQPMHSADGRFVISYNGEVYNTAELRAELEALGVRFRGHSDTEVMVEACAAWGIDQAVTRFVGMFAFALWDRRARSLTLVRDRLGIKPLYWAEFGDLILFGSELKALRAHDGWHPALDRDALAAYLRFSYVPTPRTIYAGVHKLPPGHMLTIAPGRRADLRCYWDLRAIAVGGTNNPLRISDQDAVAEVEALLRLAVRQRMIADVPLGALLSGGIDSSSVVALMQAQSNDKVRTFSIGFTEDRYNEADMAGAVAAHLGTDHTELYVDPSLAQAIVPGLADWYDEPFADSSQIPTQLVSRLARQHVTVALSGDGGDEVFAGYTRYLGVDRLWRHLRYVPRPARCAAGALLQLPSPAAWDGLASMLPRRYVPPQIGDKIHKGAALLAQHGPDAMYKALVTHWPHPEALLAGAEEPATPIGEAGLAAAIPALVSRLRYLDMATYLHDDILTKVDRASMAHSLEVRVPLLDHRVVEFAWRLPRQCLISGGQGKAVLRRMLHRYVPKRLVERPKMGFAVPIDSWLRGPLRAWAEDLLDPHRLRREGMFEAEPIRRTWAEHLSGRRNHQYRLWNLLMFQAWRVRWQM